MSSKRRFGLQISTHAPAQGATRHQSHTPRQRYYFNPRSRTGSDGTQYTDKVEEYIFQPTLPHRERQQDQL